jgi:hypothetical protein
VLVTRLALIALLVPCVDVQGFIDRINSGFGDWNNFGHPATA